MQKKIAEKFMRKNLNTNERKMEEKTMRKNLFVVLLFVAMFIVCGKTCDARTNYMRKFRDVPMTTKTIKRNNGKYVVNVYWRRHRIASYRFNTKPIVKFIHIDKLTYEMVTKRRSKILYIEWEVGKQINKKGDGKLFVKDPRYNYISYKRQGFKKGDIIRTFCVYSPYNNWCDDIVERYDEKIR